MANYESLFKNHLDRKGIRYRDAGDGVISISYDADNINTVEVLMAFSDDGEPRAQFVSFSIGKFPSSQFAKALVTCNALNNQYRWFKFYVDDNETVCCSADAIVDEETCGEECLELVIRMVRIVDEVYPEFMKARWS